MRYEFRYFKLLLSVGFIWATKRIVPTLTPICLPRTHSRNCLDQVHRPPFAADCRLLQCFRELSSTSSDHWIFAFFVRKKTTAKKKNRKLFIHENIGPTRHGGCVPILCAYTFVAVHIISYVVPFVFLSILVSYVFSYNRNVICFSNLNRSKAHWIHRQIHRTIMSIHRWAMCKYVQVDTIFINGWLNC